MPFPDSQADSIWPISSILGKGISLSRKCQRFYGFLPGTG